MKSAVVKFRQYDRTVLVKGLAEQEYPADLVLWPIIIQDTSDNISTLYASFKSKKNKIKSYLLSKNVQDDEITITTPRIVDRNANEYGNVNLDTNLRYA